MRVSGGTGAARPSNYKVSVGVLDGFIAEAQISYAGPGALARTELARTILQRRMARYDATKIRFDMIGLNLHPRRCGQSCNAV